MTDVYVDAAFVGLSNGASAVWNSSAESRKGVTIGTTGFSTLAAAITAVESGGTVWLADTTVDAPATITKDVVIRGMNGVIQQDDVISITDATVRFRDVTFSVDAVDPLAVQVKASSRAIVGFMHCTFEGDSVAAVESNGSGSAVAVVGCEFGDGVTADKKVVAKNGAASAIYARTTQPTGGPSRRYGNTVRHKMRLEAPADYRDVSKGQKKTWVPVDVIYASIEPLRGEEYMAARLGASNATHRIEIPGGVTVNPSFRMVHRERAFELNTPLATDGYENRTAFLALEGVA